MDAWLAAFAMSCGFEMVTTDKAFKQFKGLHLRLVEAGE
jgi:predicted nucleic acid-binding protein